MFLSILLGILVAALGSIIGFFASFFAFFFYGARQAERLKKEGKDYSGWDGHGLIATFYVGPAGAILGIIIGLSLYIFM